MKNVFNNTRNAAIAVAALFALSFSTPAAAAGEPLNDSGVEFKLIGNIENHPVLQVTFNNAEESDFMVEVIDEYNNVLYKDYVKANNTTKKFMLNTDELGNVGVRFEITGKKSNKKVVFEVNRNSRTIEDVVVNQVK